MIKELFYTPKEVAELLRIHWRTLSNWRMKNKGPQWKKLGKYRTAKILYQYEDVHKWIEEKILSSKDYEQDL